MFLDELFKISAGEQWESMKIEFKKRVRTLVLCVYPELHTLQYKVVVPDARIETIMESAGQCIEDCNDKMVRISVMKLLTGVFSQKEASNFLHFQSFIFFFSDCEWDWRESFSNSSSEAYWIR